MGCAMKVQLASEHEAATTLFSKAVAELRQNLGTSTKKDYEQLDRLANDARVKSEQARLALEKHTAEHRC